MTSRQETPSASAKRAAAKGRSTDDRLDSVLDQLGKLRQDVEALRDEIRAMDRRRAPRRERASRDPGDSVPPGVAVQEPSPLSAGERRARRNLERLSRD